VVNGFFLLTLIDCKKGRCKTVFAPVLILVKKMFIERLTLTIKPDPEMKNISRSAFILSLMLIQFSLAITVNSQTIPADDSLAIMEKVYLHVDRDSYLAGEDIWFKAYLIDALDHLLTDHSNTLHVELISPYSKIVSSRKIRLEGGLGNGDFKLSGKIMSGRYRLRAYTNYMRNFSDQLFFVKEITIVNPDDKETETDRVKYVENKIKLSFYPEGGSLIDNVSSLVAFKAVDNLGKGQEVTGKVFSSNGDLITSYKSSHLGMGSFFLRPSPGLRYYSEVRRPDSTDFRTELPVSFPKGVALSATINQDNELLVTAKTNSETLRLVSEQKLLLSISIRKEIIKTISFKIESPVTSFVVPTDYLPEGILMLTLATPENLPLSERLVFIERDVPPELKISTNKLVYQKRDPVVLKIYLPGDSTAESQSNVSLSVVDQTFSNTKSLFTRNISSWFLLESDVHGNVEDPSYYFDPSNPDRLKDLDLLLRTQGWRDFNWKYNTTYFPGENGFTISGRLKNNKHPEESRVSIGIFGSKSSLFKVVPVDSMGRFSLSGIDLTGQAMLIATGIGKKDHPDGLLTLDSMVYNPAIVTDSLLNVLAIAESFKEKLKTSYRINEAIKRKYKLSDTISVGEVSIISERHKDPQTLKIEQSRSLYLKPESEVVVTEQMVGYENLLQILNGRVPGLVVLKDTSISIRGLGSIRSNSGPLILIDGNQAEFRDLVDMPVFLVDRIDVLKSVGSTVIYGLKASGGVINIITRAGGMPVFYNPPEYSAKHRISGYNEPRIFSSSQPLNDSGPGTDIRNTLLWVPDIDLEATGEVILNYYNADNTSRVSITAEGMTRSGIPLTGKAEYEVR
jgi:hypothetical protein